MKNEINALYVDHTSRNADPFKLKIEYEDNRINVFCIGHGVFANRVFRDRKLNLIIEDDHDTGQGKYIIKTLIEQYAFTGYQKTIDLGNSQQSEHRTLDYYCKGKLRKITKRREEQAKFTRGLINKVIEECKGRNKYEESKRSEGLDAHL